MNIYSLIGLVCVSGALLAAFLIWAAARLGSQYDQWRSEWMEEDYDGEWLGR